MLNMNQYDKVTDLFDNGFALSFGSFVLNRYEGGEIRGKLSIGSLESSGTGHWPFHLFDLNFLTGCRSAWQVTVLGWTVGSRMVHDLNEDGSLNGPDKREYYSLLSCLNHRSKTLEDIIYAD